MENRKKKHLREKEKEKKDFLTYEPPKIITYSGDEILDELGPAQACSPVSSVCPFPG